MSTIGQWMDELQKNDVAAQATAAEALAALGPQAQPALLSLVQTCGSSDEAVRNWCTAALEEIGPPAAEQIEALKSLARAANLDVAFWAVTLLGRSRAVDAIPILKERLNDASAPAVQQRAAWALKNIEAV
ncbi:MAG: HEAT repeat domain-containing protein [Pirellulales bacterium]|nr:HEAT repeat domain-containing protein [Pirellulales bacterium]